MYSLVKKFSKAIKGKKIEMNWLNNFVKPKLIAIKSKLIKKENLWTKCPSCHQMIFTKELKENLFVCDNCNYHMYACN